MIDCPERSLDQPEYDCPTCPICGEETDTFYRVFNDIIGCPHCIDTVDAWEHLAEVENEGQ